MIKVKHLSETEAVVTCNVDDLKKAFESEKSLDTFCDSVLLAMIDPVDNKGENDEKKPE